MSKKTQVKVLPPQTTELPSEEQIREKRLAAVQARQKASTLLPDRLANSTFYVRNYPIPRGKELFPLEWRMQYAEICYPHAEGGPLFLDFPRTEFDLALCERKRVTLHQNKIRYAYLKNGVTENEARQMLGGL